MRQVAAGMEERFPNALLPQDRVVNYLGLVLNLRDDPIIAFRVRIPGSQEPLRQSSIAISTPRGDEGAQIPAALVQ